MRWKKEEGGRRAQNISSVCVRVACGIALRQPLKGASAACGGEKGESRRETAPKICGRTGGEGRDASSKLGSDEAGDDGSDKATRAAIARAYEVDRGDGGGESGARKAVRAGAKARAGG